MSSRYGCLTRGLTLQDIQYDNLRLVVWFIVPALSIVLWYEKADNVADYSLVNDCGRSYVEGSVYITLGIPKRCNIFL